MGDVFEIVDGVFKRKTGLADDMEHVEVHCTGIIKKSPPLSVLPTTTLTDIVDYAANHAKGHPLAIPHVIRHTSVAGPPAGTNALALTELWSPA